MWVLAVTYYCCVIMMYSFNFLGLSLGFFLFFFFDETASMNAGFIVRAF